MSTHQTSAVRSLAPGEQALDWRDRMACKGEDTDLFFPEPGSGDVALQTAAAKAVCRRCPVRRPCLREALDVGIEHGVVGGRDEDERKLLAERRERRRAARQANTKVTPIRSKRPDTTPAADVAVEVARLAVKGNSTAWIAAHLRIPEQDVTQHLQQGAAA